MKIRASTPEAYQLLHEGAVALAEVESAGIKIDLPYLHRTIAEIKEEIADNEAKIQRDEVWKTWQRTFKHKSNLYSLEQMGHVLFEKMGYECHAHTATGRPKADESAFEAIDLPFVKQHIWLRKLVKVLSTNLEGILAETVDGYLHPFFHLHLVISGRSSSSSINFQNLPVRNARLSKIARQCFIPRSDKRHFVEVDFKAIEVKIAACHCKDPMLVKYVTDPATDMHRDMAIECFLLNAEQCNKMTRYAAKNMFVFPQFYGDYYVSCARGIWEAIDRLKLMVDDMPMKQHLRSKGIKELGDCDPAKTPCAGTFEAHIQKVEKDFWGKRFSVYNQWKKDYWEQYQRTGGFRSMTGFWVHGVMRRNVVLNLSIQGGAFHCLLQSIIWLQKWLKKHKFKTLIIGQVHDSVCLDVPDNELEDVLEIAQKIMTKWIPKAWPWVIVPLEVEAEVAPLGLSWYHKQPVPVKDITCPTDGIALTWDPSAKKWGWL